MCYGTRICANTASKGLLNCEQYSEFKDEIRTFQTVSSSIFSFRHVPVPNQFLDSSLTAHLPLILTVDQFFPIAEHFAKVSSQQNQQLNSEASKIPAGSGPALDSAEDMSSSKESDKDPSRKLKIQKRPELTNGGSLEDCISNVYSLLELPGIKWKCFRTKPNAPRGAPLTTELVLKAYSKCLLDGILCTWRRKQLTVNGSHELPLPIFNNDTPKELWVFWYNDEPVEIQKHCEGLEVDEEVSSANQMNLVSYEVRTILFKALHVVLERDLTKDGYVRFGRWFTVPLEPREHYLHYMYPTYSPAIRLNFFVHGSSTVCASVQAQRQPTLLTLARRHLEHKSAKTVIVGPWSMRGTLVPNQFSLLKDPKMQERAEKEWNHWNEYLQMEEKEPEVVPDTEKRSSPEPDTPQPLPHRSLLIDSSDEEVVPSAEPVAEPTSEEIPARMKWMYEPEIRTDKPKEETAEEKEKREKAREVRRKRRKAREERRKELERKRTENTNPDEYDSEVVTDPEEDNSEELVNNEVPRMVLLDIDGVRMLYPTKFICVTLEDDRQVLEAVGLKPNTIPEELQGKGRRPRNRFVVNVANPILSTQAVWQYCKTEKGSIYDKVVINPSAHGYTQPMAPIKRKLVQWRYLNRRKPCDGGNVCPACKFHKRRAKQIGTFTLDAADSKCLYKDMINRVRRKHDFEAFHKKHNVRVKPMSRRVRRRVKRKNRKMRLRRLDAERKIKRKPKYIMSLKRQRRIAEKEEEIQKKLEEDELKELKEITDKDELRPNDTLRGDSEDEYQMDKLSKNDWAHLGEKGKEPPPKVVDEDGVEKEPDIFNSIRIAKPPHDENYKPEPFLPVSVISRKTFGDFEYKAGDEDMSEERFNEVYHDKSGKWRPGMSRAEKIECADFQFDPANQQKEPHMPYHLKEAPKKIKWEAKLPMPRNNKYFKGAICRRGLRGYNDMIERVDKAKEMKKALYLRKYGRSKRKFQRKLAMWCSKKLVRQLSGRSLDKAVKNLRKIAEKDNRSDGTKQYKLSVAARKKKYEDKKKEAAKKKKPLVEDALHKLNVDSFCARFEKDGPHGEGMAVGYIPPDYATSPNSHVDEDTDPETEEQINGLGEGTSGQYQDGEPVDVDMEPQYVEEPNMEVAVAVSHVRSAGEHIGPEGLLSPPASNEMPKGGPLSVGPPSIESQGLNQIYPTPPSVQMLQGDAAQAHSPILHGKARYVGATEDDVERIAVPGGGGTIVEIEADDDETENMKKWNGKSTQSKMSKFLASSSKDPVLTARQKKYTTPMTEKFKIVEEAPKVPNRLVYTEMVRKKFGCAPHHHFAELVRSKLHEKRSVPSSASVGPNLHPQMFPQASPLVPMFQTPSMPSHTPSSSVGPMGHHSMAGHGFPGTPGPFPPTTPTYSGMMSRPGYGPGPGYPNHHQMMPPGYSGPMGQRTPFMSPPNVMATQQQMHMARMQQMMQNRQMSVQGMPPGYGAPGIPHYPPGPGTPGPSGYGMQHQGTSSVQQLNQFVNHPRFGANGPHPGHPPPYGALQSMVPQSPSFNQPFGGMNNSMMSPMQQHQFHQQQMQQQQQMQMQQHQQQMQRNQMHNQQQLAQQQSIGPPTPQHLHFQTSMQWKAAHNQLNKRQVHKFKIRQIQLIRGVRPTSLQPVPFRKIRNQPDANIPINKQNLAPPLLPDLNVPEGDSLTIAIMLSDTILDLHFDSVFDACPICACSVSIRSRDLGMYITPHEVLRPRSHNMMGPSHSNMREHTVGAWSGFHHVNSGTNCTCGFSAIRHRYLSCCTGLFAEDANEATNLNNAVAAVVPPMNYPKRGTSRNTSWFDSRSVHDLALLDQIRQMSFSNSLGKAVSQMASVAEHRRDLNKAVEVTMDITDPSEYVISNVDSMELRILGKSAINTCMKTPTLRHHKEPPNQMYQFLQYFHPWGLQTANEITELEGNEWVDLLETMTSTLGSAMKQAKRNTTDTDAAVEGPLTWKNFVTKSTFIKGKPNAEEEEDMSLAEPIPAVMRATAKEAIRTAPHIDQYYDLAGLGPVDQPKDVMYITVIPDDDVIYERTVRFMDQITETYERMKLGHHVPFPISTKTATRFRELYKENQVDFNLPDQHVQLVSYVNQLLRREHQLTVPEKNPVNNRPEYWERIDELRRNANENLNKGPGEDFGQEYNGTHEEFSHPTESFKKILGARKNKKLRQPDFFDREGILRVGTPCEPIRTPLNQTVTSTAEFSNMTKHLRDAHGFVTKLRIYLQQMEDLVTNALDENKEAFERHGYRYQLAVEARLKRKEHKRKKEEEFHRYNAAKKIDDLAAKNPQTQDDLDDLEELKQLIPGFEFLDDEATDYVDEEEEDRKRKKQKEDEQYPPEGPQAPSPIPAGMVHIPETLSEQERATQPSLADLMSDPNSVLPHNAANISWTQRDTSVPNPFPSSNQPPVPFESVGSADTDDHATLPHVIVIYMVNPFNYGPEGHNALHMRIAIISFIRVFNAIMGRLPFSKRPQLQLEIVGMESMDMVSKPMPDYFNDARIPFDILHERSSSIDKPSDTTKESVTRSLAVAVYTHPRVFFPDVYKGVASARCMTAFGPGSEIVNILQELKNLNEDSFARQRQRSQTHHQVMMPSVFGHPSMVMPQRQRVEKKNYIAYRIPSTIVSLAPPPLVCQMKENAKPQLHSVDEQTLFVSYCLVGTDFLVATATDAQGKLIDNCIANIKPRRQNNELYRYRNKTQILDGMGKLWNFILGIMSSEIKNWRLVVGRLGRIGHGEFRAWTHLLNKTSLLRYSSSLKDICGACRSMPSIVGTPAILSACLITLEPEPNIRIIPDYYDPDISAKKNSLFHTPGDLSCTHILTFPVGAEINLEVQDHAADPKAEENWEFGDLGDLDIMEGLDDGDTEIMKDLGLETPNSAAIRQLGGSSMFFSEDSSTIEIQNQPLASGYYISTAPAPELPTWFWATCPSARRHSPVHLKSSLHINISEVKNDDIAMESTKEKDKDKEKEEVYTHPLESRQTEEVLRHVLESYNALSWLNMNRENGDRYSCLPIHIQHLLRLYHSVARLLV